jgi:hypothetical protein
MDVLVGFVCGMRIMARQEGRIAVGNDGRSSSCVVSGKKRARKTRFGREVRHERHPDRPYVPAFTGCPGNTCHGYFREAPNVVFVIDSLVIQPGQFPSA